MSSGGGVLKEVLPKVSRRHHSHMGAPCWLHFSPSCVSPPNPGASNEESTAESRLLNVWRGEAPVKNRERVAIRKEGGKAMSGGNGVCANTPNDSILHLVEWLIEIYSLWPAHPLPLPPRLVLSTARRGASVRSCASPNSCRSSLQHLSRWRTRKRK